MEMMEERGLSIAHTTIMRWVHQYGPQLEGIQLRQVRYLNNIVEHRIIVLLRNA
ncbi:Transposase [Bacillus mycoides]|nr:Transposase [Bacillus mycoides]